MWSRLTDTKDSQLFDSLLLGLVVLFIAFGITNQTILIIVIAILTIYSLFFLYFNRTYSEKIELVNVQQTTRLFPDDEDMLTLTLINHAPYPYLNGKISFQTTEAIEVDAEILSNHTYLIPVTLWPKRKTVVKVPLKAAKRGVGNIFHLRFQFAHLLNFQQVTLRYNPYMARQFIVFPTPEVIHGLPNQKTFTTGENLTAFSPFQDPQQILGVRDYTLQDSFKMINWQASLKAQSLQVNQFEKVIEKKYHIVLNIQYTQAQGQISVHPEAENYYRYATYLIHQLEKMSVPYALSINIRKLGQNPFLHLRAGHGQAHQFKLLEQIARIRPLPLIYPADKMFYKISKFQRQPQVVCVIGNISLTMKSIIHESWPNVFQVYHLQDQADPVLRPLSLRGRSYGT